MNTSLISHLAHMSVSQISHDSLMNASWISHVPPRTEETGLTIITTTTISNKFSLESPYISNTFSRESPKFQTDFQLSKGSPRHSKDLPEIGVDLEIQIFQVNLLRERQMIAYGVAMIRRLLQNTGLFCRI